MWSGCLVNLSPLRIPLSETIWKHQFRFVSWGDPGFHQVSPVGWYFSLLDLGTGLGYPEAPLHGAQRWWWWWWCVFCQMDEQLLGSQLDRGGWARTPGPPWITRRQLQEKLPALPSELLQWNQGRTKLGEGGFSSVFLRILWYEVFFGGYEYFQTFFYIHKKPFYHFILSSKGPDFHLLSNDSFIFSDLRYI